MGFGGFNASVSTFGKTRKTRDRNGILPRLTDAGLCWFLSTGGLGAHPHSSAMGLWDGFRGAGVLKP